LEVVFKLTYTDVFQTVNGCDSTISTVLTVNSLPVITITAFSPDTICATDPAVNLPSVTPAMGTFTGAGVSGTTFDPSISGVGNFFVTYSFTDANNCSNIDSTSITVEVCVGINENDALSNINIFPNPVSDIFTQELNVELVDVTGKTIRTINVSENSKNVKVDVSNLNKGIYFLVITSNGENTVRKIFKI